MLVMEDHDICKRILNSRARSFVENLETNRRNDFDSPIYDILEVSIQVGLFETCMRMITSGVYVSKYEWKKLVWQKVWQKEDDDCNMMYKQPHQDILLYKITGKSYYLVWWILATCVQGK